MEFYFFFIENFYIYFTDFASIYIFGQVKFEIHKLVQLLQISYEAGSGITT